MIIKRVILIITGIIGVFSLYFLILIWLNITEVKDKYNILAIEAVNYDLNCIRSKEIKPDTLSSICINVKFDLTYFSQGNRKSFSPIQPGLNGSGTKVRNLKFLILSGGDSIDITSLISSGEECMYSTCYSEAMYFENVQKFLHAFNHFNGISAPEIEKGINFNIQKKFLSKAEKLLIIFELANGRKLINELELDNKSTS